MSTGTTTPIVFPEDEAAASIKTVTGWVSRTGHYWGRDEHTARHDGSTHRHCECGAVIEKRSYCRACHDRREAEKYAKMPRKAWDGNGMLYSAITEHFYNDLSEAEEDLDEGQTLADLMLVFCKPNYVQELDDDYCADDLPEEEDEAPAAVREAMEAFNKAVAGIVLSWSPSDTAVLIEEETVEGGAA